jgi:hypothetical protein
MAPASRLRRAAALLGCAVGALLAGKPADRIGCIRMMCSPRCG